MLSEKDRVLSELCQVQAIQAHRIEAYSVSERWYHNALCIEPENEDIIYSSIYPLALQRKYPEAIARCTKSMQSEKHKHDAEYTRGLLYLTINDYKNGFKDFEIRLKQRQLAAIHDRLKHKPYWNGEDCNALYIYGEQGFGDIFMFSRYLPLIKTKFKVDKIYFEVPKSCKELLSYNFRNDKDIEVISERKTYATLGTDEAFHKSDFYIQQLSLPRLFETTFETVPEIKLEAEPEYIEKYKYLSDGNAVGVIYGGRDDRGDFLVKEWNDRRNINPDILNEILKSYNIVPLQQELNPNIKTWSDTAGIMANCKFIVSVDSGPVHVAGGLGVETIMLNHYQTCWRFTLDQKYTPWYSKNFTIIRQKLDRNWDNVFQELQDYFRERVCPKIN